MSAAVLRDVELVLAGVLPADHVLGGPVAARGTRVTATGTPVAAPGGPATPGTVLELDPQQCAAALAAGSVDLLDEEMTPIATLTGLVPTGPGQVKGVLGARRRRESGAGRDAAVGTDDRAAGWARVLVLARPVLASDAPTLEGVASVLVPDHPSSTAGVPTAVMLQLAHRLAQRLGGIPVRTVPLAWRDDASNAALLAAVADFLGAGEVALLAEDPSWRAAAAALDGRLDDADLTMPDADILARWRPARPRRGLVVMLSGLSGSGKSTVARGLAQALDATSSRTVSLLDGDIVRQMLSAGLGFDRESRIMNVRRIGYVGAEIARHGGIAICAPIAPYASTRAEVRAMAQAVGDFVLVHVNTPLAECERRDLKGLYAKARAGLIPEFTGISDPYDEPVDADLRVDTSTLTQDEAVAVVLDHLVAGGWVNAADPQTTTSPNTTTSTRRHS